MNMANNQKPHHLQQRTIDKRNLVQKQRKSIAQTEVASAMLFLRGDALTQACTLLMNQSRHLFDDTVKHSGQCNDSASESAKSSKDGSPFEDEMKQSSQDYTKQLSDLHQKCKRAHEIVIQADEMGQLERSSGMNSIPSSPHPNSSITTPRSAHATPGVVVKSMPPLPPSMGGSNIHRRNIPGTTSASLNTNRLQLKKKPSDLSMHAMPKLQRANSNAAETSKPSATQSNLNPPEAVLNFLKKLNSNGASDDTLSGSQPIIQLSAIVPAQAVNSDKKRKATSPPPNPPPPQAKRPPPPPPPPPSATSSRTSSAAAAAAAPSSKSQSPPSPERRSRRSASKRTSPVENSTKIHGVGESVMVNDNGMWYAAIVKDVECDNDGDGLVTYEVEFDNGEIRSGVLPVDIRDNEDD